MTCFTFLETPSKGLTYSGGSNDQGLLTQKLGIGLKQTQVYHLLRVAIPVHETPGRTKIQLLFNQKNPFRPPVGPVTPFARCSLKTAFQSPMRMTVI